MPHPPASAVNTWADVLEAEYEALSGSEAFPGGPPSDPDSRLRALHALQHQRRASALCLSGGGIRSGVFGLGVLQGLAHYRLLSQLDYLSTVSGGGYIGGWFSTWLHREDPATVMGVLDPERPAAAPRVPDLDTPLDRVRDYCRYLAPRGGLLSADVWTLLATMGRNLFLNWMVLLPLLAAALLVPRVYYALVHAIEVNTVLGPGEPCLAVSGPSFWLLLVAGVGWSMQTGYITLNFVGRGSQWPQRRFLAFAIAPMMIGAVALTLFWSAYPCALDVRWPLFFTAVVPAAGWILIGALARPNVRTMIPAIVAVVLTPAVLAWGTRWDAGDPQGLAVVIGIPLLLIGCGALNQLLEEPNAATGDGRSLRIRIGVRPVAAALLAGPILGGGTYWFARHHFWFGTQLGESYAAFAVPGILALGLLALIMFVGISSEELSDAVLEWWSRCAAWIGIAATVWLAAGVLVFYCADLVEDGVQAASVALSTDRLTLTAVVSVLVPLISSLAGLAARGGTTAAAPSRLRMVLQRVALPAVIVVLLSFVAWVDRRALEFVEYHDPMTHPMAAGLGEVVLVGVVFTLIGLAMSRFVPVNRFSLHGMYQQRLMRTFLGASHRARQPNAFTGFDPRDDIRVHELRGVRPLHVINATLNSLSSSNIGRNERIAQPFTFSPLHVGSADAGYRSANEYGSDGGRPGTGLSLSMALAVSGAAASPAMGIFSSKARAFLLTLANARLGLWFGNPGDEQTWQRSEPPLGVGPLLREMLGLTTEQNPYVYLSDGGHFENLGLYEMVARRCGLIVVSDAGCDPEYTFDDLSNAIRRIRIDLGIPIEIDPLHMTRAGQGTTNRHSTTGRIRYSVVDGEAAPDGVLLYIKATLSGDEPVELKNFSMSHPAFPHDSTGNQFFSEAQFESYRALGYHSILSVGSGLAAIAPQTLDAFVANATSRESMPA